MTFLLTFYPQANTGAEEVGDTVLFSALEVEDYVGASESQPPLDRYPHHS